MKLLCQIIIAAVTFFAGIAMVQCRMCEPFVLQAVKGPADAAWCCSFRDGMDLLDACKVISCCFCFINATCQILYRNLAFST